MNRYTLLALCATLLVPAAPAVAAAETAAETAALAEGVIKRLDPAAGKITIDHGQIANLDMPAMTMTFQAKLPAELAKWKEGDKIRFRAAKVNGVLTVYGIEAAK